MARRTKKPEATFATTLTPLRETCEVCGAQLWVAYHRRRKVLTLKGLWQLRVVMCHCPTPTCPRYHVRSHPEEEGRWALPHGEFGLDVIALIGQLRSREHRSVPEIHQALQARDIRIAERTVLEQSVWLFFTFVTGLIILVGGIHRANPVTFFVAFWGLFIPALSWATFLNSVCIFMRDSSFVYTLIESTMEFLSDVRVPLLAFPFWIRCIGILLLSDETVSML